MNKPEILYVVIPCFNEEEVLHETASQLEIKVSSLIEADIVSPESRIVFVDDGSKDSTWDIIRTLYETNHIFSGIKLSRNRGHQNALLAGLMTVKELCDYTVSMDADLQDDVNVIDMFIAKYNQGNDIVYGVRNDRKSDTTVKRGMAELFYSLMTNMGVESIFNHADCRLMSKRSLDALSQFKEVNLFLRGMVPLIGFKSDRIEYTRAPRFAGTSKYPFKKMLQLALNGITSFSIAPIRLVTVFGITISALGILTLIALLVLTIFGVNISSIGWIITSIYSCCGFIITSIGVVGEYVGKTYEETKQRPRYIIEEFCIKK